MGTRIVYPNYFPFCLEEITDSTLVGEGTDYPLPFSLADMLHLYWVTKLSSINIVTNWSTSGTYNFLGDDYSTAVSYNGGILTLGEYATYPITTESDFLCNVVTNVYFDKYLNDYQKLGELDILSSDFGFLMSINVSSVYFFNGSYYPRITFEISNGTRLTENGDFVIGNVVVFLNNRGDPPSGRGDPTTGWTEVSHKINIFGKSFNLQGWKNDLFNPFSFTESHSSETTITMNAGYWEYATKGGLPVYDSATGAQLNNPFS
jgi:hypothetical protein